MSLIHLTLGMANDLRHRARDERGLSQSTEQAILLAGAAAIAILIVVAIRGFVEGKLAQIGG